MGSAFHILCPRYSGSLTHTVTASTGVLIHVCRTLVPCSGSFYIRKYDYTFMIKFEDSTSVEHVIGSNANDKCQIEIKKYDKSKIVVINICSIQLMKKK